MSHQEQVGVSDARTMDENAATVVRNEIPQRLFVVYDERCEFCQRCRDWLERQALYVPVEFIQAGRSSKDPRFSRLSAGQELVVVGDGGEVWKGAEAMTVCLWATMRYRPLSFRLSGKSLSSVTKAMYRIVSRNRYRL